MSVDDLDVMHGEHIVESDGYQRLQAAVFFHMAEFDVCDFHSVLLFSDWSF